jgi:hypothetical protein
VLKVRTVPIPAKASGDAGPRHHGGNEIVARLDQATDVAAEAIAQRFGRENVDGKIQTHIVTIESVAN